MEEINNLKLKLKTTKNSRRVIKKENESLKQTLYLSPSQLDDLEQYRRRKNIRIPGINESESIADDGKITIKKRAYWG